MGGMGIIVLGLVCILVSSCSPELGTVETDQDDIIVSGSNAFEIAPISNAPLPPDFRDLPQPPLRPSGLNDFWKSRTQ